MNPKFYSLSEEKRSAILNAGFHVFSQNTYKKSPMSEIADAAGISKALLFHCFHNKKELYLFLWDTCCTITVEEMTRSGAYEQTDLFGSMDYGMQAKLRLMRLEKMPEKILSLASTDTDHLYLKVDEQNVIIGRYDNGALFSVMSAIRTETPDTAWIYGTKGYIQIPVFWKPECAEIVCDGAARRIESPVPQRINGISDEGYQYEIRHVQECLRQGLIQSPMVTHAMTRDVLEMCDEIRRQWGLVYPFEQHRE
jgi:AcrR family transcriptional regulator